MRRPPRSSSSPNGADRFPTSLVALGLVVLFGFLVVGGFTRVEVRFSEV